MKDLPYFLLLIKKNAILWSIITTSSFSNVDLKNTVHGFWTKDCLELRDYSLSPKDKFKSIKITITDIGILIDFHTTSDKYIKNTNVYFDRDTTFEYKHPYYIDNFEVTSSQKRLGNFDMGLDRDVGVDVVNSIMYGNVIGITIYEKDWANKLDN